MHVGRRVNCKGVEQYFGLIVMMLYLHCEVSAI